MSFVFYPAKSRELIKSFILVVETWKSIEQIRNYSNFKILNDVLFFLTKWAKSVPKFKIGLNVHSPVGHALHFGQKKIKNFRKSQNQRYLGHLKTKVLLVRLWHSNVNAPSARKFFWNLILSFVLSWRKVFLIKLNFNCSSRQ